MIKLMIKGRSKVLIQNRSAKIGLPYTKTLNVILNEYEALKAENDILKTKLYMIENT